MSRADTVFLNLEFCSTRYLGTFPSWKWSYGVYLAWTGMKSVVQDRDHSMAEYVCDGLNEKWSLHLAWAFEHWISGRWCCLEKCRMCSLAGGRTLLWAGEFKASLCFQFISALCLWLKTWALTCLLQPPCVPYMMDCYLPWNHSPNKLFVPHKFLQAMVLYHCDIKVANAVTGTGA